MLFWSGWKENLYQVLRRYQFRFGVENFNFQLFDLFEEKMGMGEDFIIGYSLSNSGDLIYHDEIFFFHHLIVTTASNAEILLFVELHVEVEPSQPQEYMV